MCEAEQQRRRDSRIPLWFKVVYTAFVAVLIPYYWHTYGPTNFLYFCDMALFITLIGIWREDPLLVSMPAVGILLPQTFWIIDFLSTAIGRPVLGMTGYMFNPALSLFARGLSFFHFWLPLVLVWLVWRLGYDPRALRCWTLLAWGLLLVCYFLMPAPPAPPDRPNLPVNIDYVYGLSEKQPQSWLPPDVYFGLLCVVLPGAFFWPTHLLLRRFAPTPANNLSIAGETCG
jgi:hypothetical protein